LPATDNRLKSRSPALLTSDQIFLNCPAEIGHLTC
jgi:hypothetical protein